MITSSQIKTSKIMTIQIRAYGGVISMNRSSTVTVIKIPPVQTEGRNPQRVINTHKSTDQWISHVGHSESHQGGVVPPNEFSRAASERLCIRAATEYGQWLWDKRLACRCIWAWALIGQSSNVVGTWDASFNVLKIGTRWDSLVVVKKEAL
ncbi:hypothetical protein RRG08_050282 [Elysia crispata]|uniref:Uncharacterized protein n=1 Tax=Elysia crispata TaxID=231223 RepID=A0AAE1B3M7_9GAST|nr:hypothetical protein RRG08_050282 [Elysia crispata]